MITSGLVCPVPEAEGSGTSNLVGIDYPWPRSRLRFPLLAAPEPGGGGLAANFVRSSVNDGRRLSYRPLDVFGLPLVVTLVCQVAAANGGFDPGIRNSVREGVYRVCEVN